MTAHHTQFVLSAMVIVFNNVDPHSIDVISTNTGALILL